MLLSLKLGPDSLEFLLSGRLVLLGLSVLRRCHTLDGLSQLVLKPLVLLLKLLVALEPLARASKGELLPVNVFDDLNRLLDNDLSNLHCLHRLFHHFLDDLYPGLNDRFLNDLLDVLNLNHWLLHDSLHNFLDLLHFDWGVELLPEVLLLNVDL